MFYVCVEDKRVMSIVNYEPTVPESITVYPISAEEHLALLGNDHYFDTDAGAVVPIPDAVAAHRQKFLSMKNGRQYLLDTDWKVMRHIREKVLGLPQSLTDEEYLALEQERQDIAKGLGAVQVASALPPVVTSTE